MASSSSSDEDDFLMWNLIRNKERRRYWVHPYHDGCATVGNFKVSEELEHDEEKFYSYYRMSQTTYKLLLDLVGPCITKQNTNYRESICPSERLLITLRHLATGSSFRSMSYIFMRGETTIGKIVGEACDAIWKVLQPLYMEKSTANEWLNVSSEFLKIWNLPNCLGAIDGKHIRIKKPSNSGSSYYNYKEYFSINLMACSDANGLFTSIDVGDYGRNNDAGVFKNSGLGQALLNGTLNIPNPSPLPGEEEFGRPFNYYFVADEAFPLSRHIIRPYSQRALNNDRRIFNYRLSRGRKIIECAFGMLVSKFRAFEIPMSCSVEKVVKIVKAACVLHNFIKQNEQIKFTPILENTMKVNICTRDIRHQLQGRPNNEAVEARNYLCQYFIKPYGAVPWQNNYTV